MSASGARSPAAAAKDEDQENYKHKQALREARLEAEKLRKQKEALESRARLEQTRIETRLQASQEERNHLRKQIGRLQDKAQADRVLDSKLRTSHEEISELRREADRKGCDLKQRTIDTHMLQVRVAQLAGGELDGLTVSQLEELERVQSEAMRRTAIAKYRKF